MAFTVPACAPAEASGVNRPFVDGALQPFERPRRRSGILHRPAVGIERADGQRHRFARLEEQLGGGHLQHRGGACVPAVAAAAAGAGDGFGAAFGPIA